ncbi:hypothetical protein D0469_06660 [Peribacillus saganii]|uniref:Uncharacterized protein n=1 Tax=Peribacillus saganii TaxID=2303992 RepID=A0A372LQF3_9BACI|nr:hypothetical protein D0469_06660 [Peribacillus saganii]
MFFKYGANSKSVNTAYFVTFVFWGVVLFINAICETYNREFISNSWVILISGLAIFFITEFITNKKTQANK